jgi:RNA-directed DNA polymerase
MEAYLEPLGDSSSFGCRPGRGCGHAVAEVANKLRINNYFGIKSQNVPFLKDKLFTMSKKPFKKLNDSLIIIKSELTQCFDTINHKWLIDNIPMPENYNYVLVEFLKIKKTYSVNGLTYRNKGVPLGGVIWPLFLNWALDGIEDLVKKFANKRFVNKMRIEFFKFKGGLYKNKNHLFLKRSVWLVRYVDEIIIGLQVLLGVHLVLLEKLKKFLKKRGLELSEEKTYIKKQKPGLIIDFLGWSFHHINPTKVNWMIRMSKSSGRKLRH